MKFDILGKPVRVMKSLLTRTRNSKKAEGVNSLIGLDTSIPHTSIPQKF